jgi:hypothetical protein
MDKAYKEKLIIFWEKNTWNRPGLPSCLYPHWKHKAVPFMFHWGTLYISQGTFSKGN